MIHFSFLHLWHMIHCLFGPARDDSVEVCVEAEPFFKVKTTTTTSELHASGLLRKYVKKMMEACTYHIFCLELVNTVR